MPRSPKRLILVFAGTILLPGLLLGVFGLRALLREKELADQEIRQRLETAAKDAELGLKEELLGWQRIVDTWSAGAAEWPARLREAVAEPGRAVVLQATHGQVLALPKGQIPYSLAAVEAAPPPRSSLWNEAEAAELRRKDYEQAIRLYRQLLARVSAAEQPAVLQRLARCARKAGREGEALSWFRKLAQAPSVRIGQLPSDLLARYEISVSEPERLNLYNDLVTGRWELDKPSYSFYAASVREQLGSVDEAERLRAAEAARLSLGRAAELFLENHTALVKENGSYWLTFWQPEPLVAILLSKGFMQSEVLLPAVRNAGGPEFAVSVAALDGDLLFSSAPPGGVMTVTRSVNVAGLPLELTTWPRDPSGVYENAYRRRNLYLGMLGVLLALLVFGGYLTIHTARAEMAMAQVKSDFVSGMSGNLLKTDF